jgi:hypothetical protein
MYVLCAENLHTGVREVASSLCAMRQTKTRPCCGEHGVWRNRASYQVVARAQQRPIAGDGDAGDAHVLLGDELVGTLVLAQVPDANRARAVAADELALVRVDDHIVDGRAVVVVALDRAGPDVPNLDCAVLRARDHPLALTVEGDGRHVGRVPFKGQDGRRVRRLDLVELDDVVARGGQEALVRRDA